MNQANLKRIRNGITFFANIGFKRIETKDGDVNNFTFKYLAELQHLMIEEFGHAKYAKYLADAFKTILDREFPEPKAEEEDTTYDQAVEIFEPKQESLPA